MNIKKLVVRTIGVATVFPNEPHWQFRQVQKLSVKESRHFKQCNKINEFISRTAASTDGSITTERSLYLSLH